MLTFQEVILPVASSLLAMRSMSDMLALSIRKHRIFGKDSLILKIELLEQNKYILVNSTPVLCLINMVTFTVNAMPHFHALLQPSSMRTAIGIQNESMNM